MKIFRQITPLVLLVAAVFPLSLQASQYYSEANELERQLLERGTTSYVPVNILEQVYNFFTQVASPVVVFTVLAVFAILLVAVAYVSFGIIFVVFFLRRN